MKSTGIVRRIDELGRIVLPKELRTTLHIRTDDPLEIFTEGDVICLRKFSRLSGFEKEAQLILNSFGNRKEFSVVITDQVAVIASQVSYLLNQPLTQEYLDCLKSYLAKKISSSVVVNDNAKTIFIRPIISKGDVVGSIAVINCKNISDKDCGIIEYMASLLSNINDN